MAVYPVSIKNQSTLYIKATKPAITAKMKSLGIKNFTIQNAVSKQMLSKIKLTPLSKVKPSVAKFSTEGRLPGGPNNPGMKPDLEARSKLPDAVQKKKDEEASKRKQQQSNKRGGSGNQKSSGSSGKKFHTHKPAGPNRGGSGNQTKKKVKPPVNKKTVGNQQKLNQKISELAKKVKSKAPNVSMSKITDTIRGVIRKRPLTSVGVAALAGATVATILKKLGPAAYLAPSQIGNQELPKKVKSGVPLGPNRPKSKTKSKTPTKTKKPANPKVAITIATPLPKPKRDNGKKKKDKGGSGMMLSLIVGGKGTTADRMKEIKAEKKLEKQLGRRPSKKELVAYLKKN